MYGMAPDDLGTRIRRARERKRWSQAQAASAIGVGVRTWGRWERGEAAPRSAIGALEDVLGVSLTSDEDPNEQEIRELGARLGLTLAEQDDWIAVYRRRRPPVRERAG